MRWFLGAALTAMSAWAIVACSSGEANRSPQPIENVGSTAQAITTACGFDTIGLPCDPDGPAGPKLECEGACAIGTSGIATCQAAAAGSLDGVVCGTTSGVGDAACKRHCSGKTCLGTNAPAGAACRPTANGNPCDGQCDGAGKCDDLGGQACAFGRNDQLCKFATCNFAKASLCVTKNLNRHVICSDTDACSVGECNAKGDCVAGPAIGCNDGNACTDDSCDPNDGGCLGINNDNNACSDGNACLTGEHCSAGACVPGTVPVDCNDNNECTFDTCDQNTGCAHIAKSCDDGNACTLDSCDPGDGACSSVEVTCNDDNPCTDDACSTATGCAFTPKNCDDNNACTADTCSAGACEHLDVACDDSDPCTVDTCDALSGCAHTAIPGCGIGTGGAGPGDGGAGPDPSAGAPSTAGETGGGGVPADGGTPGTGDAGAPSNGGTSTAGTAGSATAGVAGTETGGTASAGSNGSAGSSGHSIGGNSTPTAGSSAEGGSLDGGTAGSTRVVDDGGCSCRVGSRPGSGIGGMLAAAALGLVVARRRRGR